MGWYGCTLPRPSGYAFNCQAIQKCNEEYQISHFEAAEEFGYAFKDIDAYAGFYNLVLGEVSMNPFFSNW